MHEEHYLSEAEVDAMIVLAKRRAQLTGVPHYVLTNDVEVWVVGKGMRNNLYPTVQCLFATDAQ